MASHRHRQLFTLLAVALFLRTLVPAGFMPGHGTLLELCTLDGVRTVLVNPQTGELLDDDPHGDGPECPWSAVFAGAVLPQGPCVPNTLFGETPACLTDSAGRFPPAYARPPARAPPLS